MIWIFLDFGVPKMFSSSYQKVPMVFLLTFQSFQNVPKNNSKEQFTNNGFHSHVLYLNLYSTKGISQHICVKFILI